MLEEFESHLGDAKQKCSESEEKANRTSKLLAKVKNGVEHLSEKLQHIKAVNLITLYHSRLSHYYYFSFVFQPHTHVLKPKVDPSSEEYVLEQLSISEQKLVSLAEELSSRDLETIHKEMADEEVRSIQLNEITRYAVHTLLPFSSVILSRVVWLEMLRLNYPRVHQSQHSMVCMLCPLFFYFSITSPINPYNLLITN